MLARGRSRWLLPALDESTDSIRSFQSYGPVITVRHVVMSSAHLLALWKRAQLCFAFARVHALCAELNSGAKPGADSGQYGIIKSHYFVSGSPRRASHQRTFLQRVGQPFQKTGLDRSWKR